MNRTDRFTIGQFFTAGEKALIVMVAAGLFGYWAGFNLSAPAVAIGMPVASPPSATAPTGAAAEYLHPSLVSAAPMDGASRDEPPIQAF
jgi:hypothetical protein